MKLFIWQVKHSPSHSLGNRCTVIGVKFSLYLIPSTVDRVGEKQLGKSCQEKTKQMQKSRINNDSWLTLNKLV